jgi:hypothetical protein
MKPKFGVDMRISSVFLSLVVASLALNIRSVEIAVFFTDHLDPEDKKAYLKP